MGYWFQVPLHFLRSWPVSWGLQPHSDDLCSRSGLHVWSHGPQEVWWGVLGERNGWHRFRWLRTMADISTKPRKKVHLANMVVILKNSSPWGIPWNCEFQQHGGCAQSPFFLGWTWSQSAQPLEVGYPMEDHYEKIYNLEIFHDDCHIYFTNEAFVLNWLIQPAPTSRSTAV